MAKLTDISVMPFGMYKGKPMQDVPVTYFHWLWHNAKGNKQDLVDVILYIKENLDVLKLENKDLIWTR